MHKYNISYENLFEYIRRKMSIPKMPEDPAGIWTEEQKEQLLGKFVDAVQQEGLSLTEEMAKILKMYYGLGEQRLTSGEAARVLGLPDGEYVNRRLLIAKANLNSDVAETALLRRAFAKLFDDPEEIEENAEKFKKSTDKKVLLEYDVYRKVRDIQQEVLGAV